MILVRKISLTLGTLKHQNMKKVFYKIYCNLANHAPRKTHTFVYAKPPYLIMKRYTPFSNRQS